MKYIFFSIFLLLFIILVIIYINISSVEFVAQEDNQEINIKKSKEITILELLAKREYNNLFPAKELYLKVNFTKKINTKILYKTIINNLNRYQIFGIEQILNLQKIKYSIIKSKNDLQLFINFDKKSQAIKIQKLFNDYGFKVTLEKVIIKG